MNLIVRSINNRHQKTSFYRLDFLLWEESRKNWATWCLKIKRHLANYSLFYIKKIQIDGLCCSRIIPSGLDSRLSCRSIVSFHIEIISQAGMQRNLQASFQDVLFTHHYSTCSGIHPILLLPCLSIIISMLNK